MEGASSPGVDTHKLGEMVSIYIILRMLCTMNSKDALFYSGRFQVLIIDDTLRVASPEVSALQRSGPGSQVRCSVLPTHVGSTPSETNTTGSGRYRCVQKPHERKSNVIRPYTYGLLRVRMCISVQILDKSTYLIKYQMSLRR